MDLTDTAWEESVSEDRGLVAASCKHANLSLGSVEGGEFLSIRTTVSFQFP